MMSIEVTEALLKEVFKACGHEIQTPFNRMKYKEAMERYGSDKPDLRYDLGMVDVIDIFANCPQWRIFSKYCKG